MQHQRMWREREEREERAEGSGEGADEGGLLLLMRTFMTVLLNEE